MPAIFAPMGQSPQYVPCVSVGYIFGVLNVKSTQVANIFPPKYFVGQIQGAQCLSDQAYICLIHFHKSYKQQPNSGNIYIDGGSICKHLF